MCLAIWGIRWPDKWLDNGSGLKGGLACNAAVREPEIQRLWKTERVYERLLEGDRPRFTLHDGPPYANGSLHMGHALNKVRRCCSTIFTYPPHPLV